ncbi:hypothetical protein B0H17DRAFT_512767 [Mycena rosella]|uniref:Uncharacterized protein n=1 Tax=Mycena rosella TaxID=1033263 RepID=A0AAD7GL29_MYCRO|nr:hypothetical protein B0H17DRAFT_512767 [Mycena rosella]
MAWFWSSSSRVVLSMGRALTRSRAPCRAVNINWGSVDRPSSDRPDSGVRGRAAYQRPMRPGNRLCLTRLRSKEGC